MRLRIALIVAMGLLLLAMACGGESTPLPTPTPLTSQQVQDTVSEAIQSLETPEIATPEQVAELVVDALGDASDDLKAEVQENVLAGLEAQPDANTADELKDIVIKAISDALPEEVPQVGGSALPIGPEPLGPSGHGRDDL